MAYHTRCEHYYQNRNGSNHLQNRVTCVQCGKLLFLHYFRECDESLVRFADMRGTPMTVQDLVHHQFPRTTSVPVTHERVTLRTVEVPVYRERIVEVPVVTERVIEKRIEVPVVEIVEAKDPLKNTAEQETQTEDEDWIFLTPAPSRVFSEKTINTDKCAEPLSAAEP